MCQNWGLFLSLLGLSHSDTKPVHPYFQASNLGVNTPPPTTPSWYYLHNLSCARHLHGVYKSHQPHNVKNNYQKKTDLTKDVDSKITVTLMSISTSL